MSDGPGAKQQSVRLVSVLVHSPQCSIACYVCSYSTIIHAAACDTACRIANVQQFTWVCLQSTTHKKLFKLLVPQLLCQSITCCSIPTLRRFAAGMLLVDTQMKTLRRPAALSYFLHCQDGHLGDIVDALRSDWLLKVGTSPGNCVRCT